MTDDRRKGDRRMPPAVADFALQQLAATPMTVQDFTHDAENYGPALNDACWTFTHECPETSALLFNNTKAPLRAAILKYAELVKPTTAENYELLQAKVDEQAREIERLEAEIEDTLVDWGWARLELAALKAQPGDPVATVEVIVEGSCKLIDFDGQKAAFKLPAGIHNLYAAPSAAPAPGECVAVPVEALEQAEEGLQVLDSLIENIQVSGNYSSAATVNFLNQSAGCFYQLRALLAKQGKAVGDE